MMVKLLIHVFSYPSVLTYILVTKKNRLIETVHISTYSICFGWAHNVSEKNKFCYALFFTLRLAVLIMLNFSFAKPPIISIMHYPQPNFFLLTTAIIIEWNSTVIKLLVKQFTEKCGKVWSNGVFNGIFCLFSYVINAPFINGIGYIGSRLHAVHHFKKSFWTNIQLC